MGHQTQFAAALQKSGDRHGSPSSMKAATAADPGQRRLRWWVGGPARPLHDTGNHRSVERWSHRQPACCGSL